ncbi:putative bifunctional diguanylate cyclase/phosphodiesterase [Rhizobium sp. TRM95796]|uniref:putative bifunctional diguanylate cyclase/phosphodiesterase n=1 Tax=Rhizobium sp. TRM95796 TaxID=2979862 RepID=UPI0021E870BD|nr:GGDEF domain-containing phosphodiesterase [Rhizobium sp. TRM95796]MCV3768423.1 EAL domain-containing protein [Rhizobium sp. TRM95796]
MRDKLTWTNNELESLLRQLDIALEASGIGIWQHNLHKNQTRWDHQLQIIYGIKKELFDVIWLESVHPEDRDYASSVFQRAINARSDYAAQFRIIRPDGETRYLRSRAKYFVDEQGEGCFIGAEWDVTDDILRSEQLAREREAAEASRAVAKFAADHDYLTGLLNRRAFDEKFAEFQSTVDAASLCHLDLDHFKEINDRFGHSGGDAVLQHVGDILAKATREGEHAARLGGDEFAVLSPFGLSRMQDLVSAIRRELDKPVILNGESYTAECSIGFACAQGQEIGALLKASDVALYEAKKLGRNNAQLFTPELAQRLAKEKQTLKDLQAALRANEIVPHYQVQIDAKTGEICGLEALARWETADGVRPPSEFLDLASAHGLMEAVDEAILTRVLLDIKRWTLLDIDVPRVSVNLSAARLSDASLPKRLEAMAAPPKSLSFELIETIFLDKVSDQIKQNIRMIRDLGILIELDDLGSGHASLLGLLELRPERVKIDRHLVAPILDHAPQKQLVGSLIDIAHALDIEVVAEGVETLAHAVMLTDLGADILQGFAFARAEPAHQITARLVASLRGDRADTKQRAAAPAAG